MKKISIIILLCLIMSVIVSCGKDNDVKDTHNTSNDNLNSEIENLNSQVAELQSQINELTSDPYNETVDEMYYEFELDGKTFVTVGSEKAPKLYKIEFDVLAGYFSTYIKYDDGSIKILYNKIENQNLIGIEKNKVYKCIAFTSSLPSDIYITGDSYMICKVIDNEVHYFIDMESLEKYDLL